MKRVLTYRLGRALFTAAVVLGSGAAPAAAQAPAQAPALQGLWKSSDTTIRITVEKGQAKSQFVEVGQNARTLGFKPGEGSFVATADGNYLFGQQTIRYGGNCHPNGRKVPVMGRMTPDGKSLALHFYAVRIDAQCRDTGEYSVSQSLWQRVAAR